MRHLDWSRQNLTVPTFNSLLKAGEKWQSAETIDLSDNFIHNERLILRLCQSPVLKELNLLNNPFELNAEIMGILVRNYNIVDFRISPPRLSFLFDHSYLPLYTWLERNRRLQAVKLPKNTVLDLSYLRLSAMDFSVIIKFLTDEKITHLTEINLSCCHLNITKAMMRQLSVCVKNNNNCRLHLKRNKLETIDIRDDSIHTTSSSSSSSISNRSQLPHQGCTELRSLTLDTDWKQYGYPAVDLLESNAYSLNMICHSNQIDMSLNDFSYLELGSLTYTYTSGAEVNTGNAHLLVDSTVSMNGMNLSGSNLSYSIFHGCSLKEACLIHVNASNVEWLRVDMSQAQLHAIDFSNANLKRCNLNEANLQCAHFSSTNMGKTSMHNADCSMAQVLNCVFDEADLTQINFSLAVIIKTNFKKAKLTGANFTGAHFSDVNFSGADLRDVNFSNCTGLLSCNFEGARLQGARLPYYLAYADEIGFKCRDILALLKDSILKEIFIALNKYLTDSRFQCFSLHHLSQLELRWLYQEGMKHPVTKDFVVRLAPFLELLCSGQVYKKPSRLKFLTRNFFFKPSPSTDANDANHHILFLVNPINRRYLKNILVLFDKYDLRICLLKSLYLTTLQSQQFPQHKFFQGIHGVKTIAFILEASSMGEEDYQNFLIDCDQERKLARLVGDNDDQTKERVVALDASNNYYSAYGNIALREIPLVFTVDEFNLTNQNTYKALDADAKAKIVLQALTVKNKSPATRLIEDNSKIATSKDLLMIIKPEGLHHLNTILPSLFIDELQILAIKAAASLSKKQVTALYSKYKDQYFYNSLVEYMTEHPVILLAVRGQASAALNTRNRCQQHHKALMMENAQDVLLDYLSKHSLKVEEAVFLEEYILTFDILHCSEPDDGLAELSCFFSEDELNQPLFVTESSKSVAPEVACSATNAL
jgi:uncharacterized protein YjbI with pentapeptide repeats